MPVVRYTNSQVELPATTRLWAANTGLCLPAARLDVTLLDDIFSGQSGAGVYFNSDSLMEVRRQYSLVSYFGDGNIYNPASGGFVATVIDGTTNNFSTLDAYAEYWYMKQYGSGSLTPMATVAIGIGYRSDQHSIQATPMFVNSSGGDFRLASVAPNYIDTGAV